MRQHFKIKVYIMTFDELSNNVIGWEEDKGILEKENAPKQNLNSIL